MLGAMCRFGKECQGEVVLQHLYALGDNLLILLHGSYTITDAEDGEHLQKGKHFLQQGLAEDVGTRHEDRSAIHSTQDDQWVEQRIGVVATDDDSPIFGQIFFAFYCQTAKRHFNDGIYPKDT